LVYRDRLVRSLTAHGQHFAEIVKSHPDVFVVATSGVSDAVERAVALCTNIRHILLKPYGYDELFVDSCLGSKQSNGRFRAESE
jgi:hypothetical protein